MAITFLKTNRCSSAKPSYCRSNPRATIDMCIDDMSQIQTYDRSIQMIQNHSLINSYMSRKVSTKEEQYNISTVQQVATEGKTEIKGLEWDQMPNEVDQLNNTQYNCQTPQKSTKEHGGQSTDKKTVGSPTTENCGCSKSGCLKLYCSCFAKGVLCNQGCSCRGCKNSNDNLERAEAINEIILKDDMAFSRKYIQDDVSEGCNCRKSGCSKKYCECFRKGKRCVEKCTCFECKNMKEGHLKTQERVMHKEQTFRKTFDLLKKKIKLL